MALNIFFLFLHEFWQKDSSFKRKISLFHLCQTDVYECAVTDIGRTIPRDTLETTIFLKQKGGTGAMVTGEPQVCESRLVGAMEASIQPSPRADGT